MKSESPTIPLHYLSTTISEGLAPSGVDLSFDHHCPIKEDERKCNQNRKPASPNHNYHQLFYPKNDIRNGQASKRLIFNYFSTYPTDIFKQANGQFYRHTNNNNNNNNSNANNNNEIITLGSSRLLSRSIL